MPIMEYARSAGLFSRIGPSSMPGAEIVTRAATSPPGITASSTGTGRPASTGTHRGNTSPHRLISPSVKITPTATAGANRNPWSRVAASSGMLITSSSIPGPPSGHGVSQVNLANPYGIGPIAAMIVATLPHRAADSGLAQEARGAVVRAPARVPAAAIAQHAAPASQPTGQSRRSSYRPTPVARLPR
ncbi:hypothetical protein GCM10028864_60520 [Microlunatus parietis]